MSGHVVIVGAGVVGLSCAHYALRKGWQVTVLERNPQQRDGCSFGNAGLIVPSHFVPLAAPGMISLGLRWMLNPESPFYIKPRLDPSLLQWAYRFWRSSTASHVARSAPLLRDLNLKSRQCYLDLAAEGLDFGLEQKGLLLLCRTRHRLDEEAATAETAHQLGLKAEVLDQQGAQALDPGIKMNVLGGVWYPEDCHLAPQRFITALQAAVAEAGGSFRWGVTCTGWRTDSKRLVAVQTSEGEVAANEFVLCGGSWTPAMANPLGLKLAMQPGKGYSLTLDDPPQRPTVSAILTEARVAVTPMNGRLRFGGTMELCGLDESINQRRIRGIIRSIPEYYPEFTAQAFAGVSPWSGLRPCSPDGLPYIGRPKKWENLTIASGHAMMGLSLAPITGRLVSQILAGEKPEIDSPQLSPDRFNH